MCRMFKCEIFSKSTLVRLGVNRSVINLPQAAVFQPRESEEVICDWLRCVRWAEKWGRLSPESEDQWSRQVVVWAIWSSGWTKKRLNLLKFNNFKVIWSDTSCKKSSEVASFSWKMKKKHERKPLNHLIWSGLFFFWERPWNHLVYNVLWGVSVLVS